MDRFFYLIALSVVSTIRVLPLIICFRLGEFLGLVVWAFLPGYRNLVKKNLSIAFGQKYSSGEIDRLVRKNFRTLGANLLCSIKIPAMSEEAIRKIFTIENQENWNAFIASNHGRGTVVALSHFGNWELNAQLTTFVKPRRTGAIYQRLRNRSLDDLINRDRRTRGVATFDRKRDLNAATTLLREGGVLGVLTDQHAGDAGVWIPFFKKLASTSPLAATLAQRTNSFLVHATVRTIGPARWSLLIKPSISTEGKSIPEITYELGCQLEEEIERSPADWFWVHNRWKLPNPSFLLARVKRGLYLPSSFLKKEDLLVPFNFLVRSPNWLGDACMAAPAVSLLKQGRPDMHLAVLTPRKLAAFWRSIPEVDEVIEIPQKASPWAVARLLQQKKRCKYLSPFDAALVLPNSPRTALEVWLTGIPRRIGRLGSKGRWRKKLINQPIPEFVGNQIKTHEADQYLAIAHWLGAPTQEVLLPIFQNSSEVSRSKDQPVRIGLVPGAEYGPAKRWPVERFRAVMEELSLVRSITWVLLGTSAEEGLATTLTENFIFSFENHIGKTNLQELIELIKGLDLLITNDTGSMHLAAFFNIPTVVIFGSTDPLLTGPRGTRHMILRHEVPCSPCFLRECPINFPCMQGVAPKAVVEAVMQQLFRTANGVNLSAAAAIEEQNGLVKREE